MAQVNGSVRVIAAQIAGKSPEMDRAAARVMRSVKSVALRNKLTGAYIGNLYILTVPGQFGTGTTVDDRVIVASDDGSIPIEYGHMVRMKGGRRVKWVPGLHIMHRGMEEASGG